MSEWKEIWDKAIFAKAQFVEGNNFRYFEELLKRFPSDGMVYYNLGSAYEDRKEYNKAIEAYKKSESLFPMYKWREKARNSIRRINYILGRQNNSQHTALPYTETRGSCFHNDEDDTYDADGNVIF
jgi:tetratricopeptide (TPR) repeat protein